MKNELIDSAMTCCMKTCRKAFKETMPKGDD